MSRVGGAAPAAVAAAACPSPLARWGARERGLVKEGGGAKVGGARGRPSAVRSLTSGRVKAKVGARAGDW